MFETKIRLGTGICHMLWKKTVLFVEEFDEETNSMQCYTYDITNWADAYNKMMFK